MIHSYGEWFDICLRHTSGDMIFDILASWKADMYVRLEEIHKLEAENKRLREALESLRETEHYECEDCFYSCPKTGACFKEVPDYAECTCGMDRRNAIIDKALKGSQDEQIH